MDAPRSPPRARTATASRGRSDQIIPFRGLITDRQLEAETTHSGRAGCRRGWTTHRARPGPHRRPPRPPLAPGVAGPHLHVPVTASPVQTRGDPTYLNAAIEGG